MKTALITGATGQDGSYLSELLLAKGYRVYGIQRRASLPNTARIDHIYDQPKFPNFSTVYGDLSDGLSLHRIINEIKPDEIYNLAGQSHVKVSFELPEYTANTTGLGSLRILESIRNLKLPTKFYQASSSEMFGSVLSSPQDEHTPFNPQSPYGLAKMFAFYATKIYRESFNLFAANGILFNHESPRRGITFVTRKITLGLTRVKLGLQPSLKLGNLDAKRDWGYAKDYVEGIWKILQQSKPDDFVLATGETHTVREFVEEAGRQLGLTIVWQGKNIKEKGIDKKTGHTIIEIDPAYFRPTEVDLLIGNPVKAKRVLSWVPKVTFKKLVEIMVKNDYDLVKNEQVLL